MCSLCVCRAHILAKKVSPRAFAEQPGKQGQKEGEVGIEGTNIQAADIVSGPVPVHALEALAVLCQNEPKVFWDHQSWAAKRGGQSQLPLPVQLFSS